MLGDKSKIIGSASAEDVLVRGHVVGSIRGLRVTLQAQSHLEGDIYHASLAIEQGAFFEGKSCRTDDPLAANAAAPSTRRAETGVKNRSGGGQRRPGSTRPRRENWRAGRDETAGAGQSEHGRRRPQTETLTNNEWRPVRELNPCFRRERPASWATRRTGRCRAKAQSYSLPRRSGSR